MFLRGSEITSGTLRGYFRLDEKVGGFLKRAMTYVSRGEDDKSKFVEGLQCSRSCSKHFLCVNAFTPHNKPMSRIVCLRSHKWQSLNPVLSLHSFCDLLMNCICFAL